MRGVLYLWAVVLRMIAPHRVHLIPVKSMIKLIDNVADGSWADSLGSSCECYVSYYRSDQPLSTMTKARLGLDTIAPDQTQVRERSVSWVSL